MNIALLIGINNYKYLNKIQACSNDLAMMNRVFRALGKYDDVLMLDGRTSCFESKQHIVDFIEKYKTSDVDEFLFYYSGHGSFDDGEFYYLWSDYKESLQNQTSISNTEIDSLIKNLAPEVTFKIVDSCQSGVQYIKDAIPYNVIFNAEKSNFKKCYFFFSSLSTQSSFADDNMSYFTEIFLRFFNKPINTKVRYRDIKDFISDSFMSSKRQTPFFIEQADNTEYYCTINSEVSEFIKSLPLYPRHDYKEMPRTDIVNIIEQDSKRFCTKDDAYGMLSHMYNTFKSTRCNDEMYTLFDIEISKGDKYTDLPQNNYICDWVSNQYDNNFFISISKEKRPKKFIEKKSSFLSLIVSSSGGVDDYTEVTRFVDVVTHMVPSVEQEYAYISITLTPKFLNIIGFRVYIAVILSQLDVAIFKAIVGRNRKNWDEFEDDLSGFSWSAMKKNIRELVNDTSFVESLVSNIYSDIMGLVEKEFLIKTTGDSEATLSLENNHGTPS